MKKSILKITLLSILFTMGACSTIEEKFLEKIAGKTLTTIGGSSSAKINADGSFNLQGNMYTIEETVDENKAVYKYTYPGGTQWVGFLLEGNKVWISANKQGIVAAKTAATDVDFGKIS